MDTVGGSPGKSTPLHAQLPLTQGKRWIISPDMFSIGKRTRGEPIHSRAAAFTNRCYRDVYVPVLSDLFHRAKKTSKENCFQAKNKMQPRWGLVAAN